MRYPHSFPIIIIIAACTYFGQILCVYVFWQWAVSKEKHIVTINWLNQCWVEHRLVPMESYRVPPFLGLVICVSRISGGSCSFL